MKRASPRRVKVHVADRRAELLVGDRKVFPRFAHEDACRVDRRRDRFLAIEQDDAQAALSEDARALEAGEAGAGNRDVVHEVLCSTKRAGYVIPSVVRERCGWVARRSSRPPTPVPRYPRNDSGSPDPEDDPLAGICRTEMRAQVGKHEWRADGVGYAVDRRHAFVRKLHQRSADAAIALQPVDDLALERFCFVERCLILPDRAATIEEVIEDRHVRKVEERLVLAKRTGDE